MQAFGRCLHVVLLGLLLDVVEAGENGRALRPPMGWRSWNLYGSKVDQALIERIMEGMVSRKRLVDGKPTSLCDLGYCDVGLDDAWQACGGGTGGYQYHAEINGTFHPVVNMSRFPDMKRMTDKAHSLGLTAGWYANNCICREHLEAPAQMYEGDVQALVSYNFDAVKLDYCGTENDLDLWWRLLNETGRPVTIENCHWGNTVPTDTWCPWNFFRTSMDIRANYASVAKNLQSTVQWAQSGLSRPGCWAYPDMLEVGCDRGPNDIGDVGLTPTEARAHFAAWAIVSSPLTLSMDVTNDTVMDEAWPIIANPEVIAVNQAWAGHSGRPFLQAEEMAYILDPNASIPATVVPCWQVFSKPLGEAVAVLLMNHGLEAVNLTVTFADVPQLDCTLCKVRDILQRRDLGAFPNSLTEEVQSHDVAFLLLSPEDSLREFLFP